jgi:hypothetical protein
VLTRRYTPARFVGFMVISSGGEREIAIVALSRGVRAG